MVNQMETVDNKYKVWHDNIIAKAKNRVLTGYQEKHHIIPKSLGGSNKKDNLVALTPKEHFIIHILLCKFTVGKSRLKMLNALHAMMFFTTKRRGYKTSSRIVANLRIEFQKNNPVFDPEVRRKIGLGNKGKIVSAEERRNMSLAHMGLRNSLGFKHPKEFGERISRMNKGTKYSLGLKHMHKDGKAYFIKKELVQEYLDKGYKLGMERSYITDSYRKLQSDKAKGKYHVKGRIFITKDGKNKLIKKEQLNEYQNLGYTVGRDESHITKEVRAKISYMRKLYWKNRKQTNLATFG